MGARTLQWIAVLRREGLVSGFRVIVARVLRSLARRVAGDSGDPVEARRLALARRLSSQFSSTVAYGPFVGLRLSERSSWGEPDRSSMLLGLYEQELLESLCTVPRRYTTFVDVGAADGYYGVGVLVAGLFARSHCFEVSERGREVIRETAAANGVLDRITVSGKAEHDFHESLDLVELERTVVLVDIEGGEFDLLGANALWRFRRSILFVELHEQLVSNGEDRLRRLLHEASAFFRVTTLRMGSRDLSGIPEVRALDDSDRWLLCSEGRPFLMSWIRLDPIETDAVG